MMNSGSLYLIEVKDLIVEELNQKDIDYTLIYVEDPDLGGYCYNIITKYSFVMVSDSKLDGELISFVLDNSMINWANREGLSIEQQDNLKCFIPLYNVDEIIEYLSTQKLKPIEIYD